MIFTDEQKAELAKPLSPAHVKERPQAGRALSYVEGWHCIAEANRIFGFDGWSRETVDLRQLGEPRQAGDKWRVAYMARVRISVHGGIVRDGSGYGSGIDKDLGNAHESALKEAETDAMKRALMTFGNPFGLALYDKEQRNVAEEEPEPPPIQEQVHAAPPPGPPPSNVATFPPRGERDDTFPGQASIDESIAASLRASIDRQKTINAVTDFMLSPETQKSLNGLQQAKRDELRDYARARLVSLGWVSKSFGLA